jgi:hypothetical protein
VILENILNIYFIEINLDNPSDSIGIHRAMLENFLKFYFIDIKLDNPSDSIGIHRAILENILRFSLFKFYSNCSCIIRCILWEVIG